MALLPLPVVRRGEDEYGLALEYPAPAGNIEVDLAPHPFLPVQNLTIDDASAPFDAVLS
jgi:hypothetical protein